MPKLGKIPSAQFNIKIYGEEKIKIIAEVKQYCIQNQISVGDFVYDALQKALEADVLPP
ncbi:MAG: hypothetical protein KME32_31490 [Mojavia pulchra JT2-VF2]|jgi:hypothetical protein|uniref:Uncharacterized protein n=1 Tax=Mojavia pulchra JT2-VF2 TaxID=287848 RepID=A0A951Q684_9NOST|nr:hypothetical protein [Mojavia pulchra JT2-VF2]